VNRPAVQTPPPQPVYRPQPLPPPPPQPAPLIAKKPEPQPDVPGLTRADLIPPGGIQKNRWKTIVVHHSASTNSTPAGMNAYHLQRGWENGLGYHFVIGNGVGYPDGQVYVGPRWKKQQTGAHCKASAGKYFGVFRAANFFNQQGIGICLIGNFDKEQPTARQVATLRKLIALLCSESGVGRASVYGHGEVTNATACPGKLLRPTVAAIRTSGGKQARGADADPALWAVSGVGLCVRPLDGALLNALAEFADACRPIASIGASGCGAIVQSGEPPAGLEPLVRMPVVDEVALAVSDDGAADVSRLDPDADRDLPLLAKQR
jgi:hypothetical protein